jgi:DNA-binding MarR family transcriptional regulator
VADLSEKEFLLLQEISQQTDASQRELAEAIGLSLGLTNLLLKRLIDAGLVSVHVLNLKKRRYELTPRGAIDRAKFACSDAAKSFHHVRRMSDNIRSHILEAYGDGLRDFVIAAPSEIETLIREAVQGLKLPGASYVYHQDPSKALESAETIFSALPVGGARDAGRRIIPILEERRLSN